MRDAALPFDDRGFAYGDGLFETLLVRDGRALLWDAHMARLGLGGERLGFAIPSRTVLDAIPAQCGAGLKVLKIVVTRGSGGRGYRPPDTAEPRWRWTAAPFAPQPARWFGGVDVRLCRLRLGWQPQLAGIKHLARLENVLARQEWDDDSIAEGLLCDSEDQLIEATSMNLLWRRHGVLETPKLDRCGVEGTLLSTLVPRFSLQPVYARLESLLEADAAWVLNSVQGVWPIRRLLSSDGECLKCWEPVTESRLQAVAHELLGYPGCHADIT